MHKFQGMFFELRSWTEVCVLDGVFVPDLLCLTCCLSPVWSRRLRPQTPEGSDNESGE